MELSTFPRDLLLSIFNCLLPEDLCTISSVCKLWNGAAADDRIWAKYGAPKWRINRTKPWKQLYIEYFRNGTIILRKRNLDTTSETRFFILFAEYGECGAVVLWKLLLQRDITGLSTEAKLSGSTNKRNMEKSTAANQIMMFRGREVKFYFRRIFSNPEDGTALYESHACLLIYDITSKSSFQKLELCNKESLVHRIKKGVGVVLVGTNLDKEEQRQVSKSQAQNFAKSLNIPNIEVSLVTEENVTECFEMLLEEVFGAEVNYMPSGNIIAKMSPRGYVPPPSHIDRTLYPGSKEYDRKYKKESGCC